MPELISTPYNDPFFYQVLYQSPMRIEQTSPFYVVRENSLLLENVSEDEMTEYCQGGELEYIENYWEESEDYYG